MAGENNQMCFDKTCAYCNIVQTFKPEIMKQPELGKKISELRKAKGLTQEELVEKCNISVRTIQRIEAGEVTPRIYTVKTIMGALEHDMSVISDKKQINLEDFIGWVKKILLLDIDENKPADFLIKQLNLAWIFGVIYFVLGFLESAAEYYRGEGNEMIFGIGFYVLLKILVLISFVFFQRGFILVGGIYKNYLLKIVSVLFLFGITLLIAYDVASVFYDAVERKFILGAASITFGGLGVIYGMSLVRLEPGVGRIAKWAGVFEAIAGCFFITIILFFIGHIVLIPAELLEIIILFKVIEIIKKKQTEYN